MTTALLIGCQYSGSKFLPGVSEDLRRIKKWIEPHISNIHIITDFLDGGFSTNEQMAYTLDQILKNKSNNLFFYYSGHGIPGALLLPDMSTYPISRLLRRCRHLFALLDCCGLGPISLNSRHPAMIITSSSGIQPSIISNDGSPFTHLFCHAVKETSDLRKIKKYISSRYQYSQMTVWSTSKTHYLPIFKTRSIIGDNDSKV